MAYKPWEPWAISNAAGAKNLAPDAIVQQLAPDPTNLPELFVMQGLIGQGATPDRWRIYRTHALDDYYEIEERYIHHAEPLAPEGARVWVLRGSPMVHVQQRQEPAEVDYLSGALAAEAARRAGASHTSEDVGGPEPTKCPPCSSRSP